MEGKESGPGLCSDVPVQEGSAQPAHVRRATSAAVRRPGTREGACKCERGALAPALSGKTAPAVFLGAAYPLENPEDAAPPELAQLGKKSPCEMNPAEGGEAGIFLALMCFCRRGG